MFVLGDLHGPLPRPIPEANAAQQAAGAPVQVDLGVLRSVISRLRSGVAPGPSGLTNDHVKQLFPTASDADSDSLGNLLAFVNTVLAGNVPEATAEWLCASNLVALYKLDPAGNLKRRQADGRPDIRPIAVPETLYRICALCALRVLKPKIKELLASAQQLGVGVPAACESIATLVRLYLEDPDADDAYVLLCDYSNAFNSICRASVLEAVAVHVPELLPFARVSYSRPGRLVYRFRGKGPPRHRVLQSRNGVRQGDPLGPVLFALGYMVAMNKVLVEHPGAVVPSYLDDTTIFGRASPGCTGDAVLPTLKREAEAINLFFNWTKTYFYFAGRERPESFDCGAAKTAVEGIIALGVPIGSAAFVTANVADRLSNSLRQIELIPQIGDFQCSMLMLRKSLVPRPRFLAAVLAWQSLRLSFTTWDESMLCSLRKLFLSDFVHPRCFYNRNGGLGLSKICDEYAVYRVNGWDRCAHVIRAKWPTLAHLTAFTVEASHPVHREVLAAWESLPNGVKFGVNVVSPMVAATLPEKEAPIARHALTDAYAANHFSDISASLDQQGRLLLHLSAESGAGAWLDQFPRFPDSRLSDTQARIAFLLWLGAPLSGLGGTALAADPSGRAALRASTRERIGSHDGIKDVFCDALAESGHCTYSEVTGLYGPYPGAAPGDLVGSDRRLDWAATDLAAGQILTGDVCRVDSAADTWLRKPDILSSPLQAAVDAEQAKSKKYDTPGDKPVGTIFSPCCVGTQGELGPGARKFIGYLAARLAKRDCGGQVPSDKAVARHKLFLMQRVGIALMRGQAIQILSVVTGTPFQALASAKRHKHSRFARRSLALPCTCGAPYMGECLCRCSPS
jgi:hypothetical protein